MKHVSRGLYYCKPSIQKKDIVHTGIFEIRKMDCFYVDCPALRLWLGYFVSFNSCDSLHITFLCVPWAQAPIHLNLQTAVLCYYGHKHNSFILSLPTYAKPGPC